MDIMVEKFCKLNPKDNDIYLLCDISFNHFQNDNYILKGKWSTTSQGWVHTLINWYKELCQVFSLEQLITWPTDVTWNTSSLIDHILANSSETTFQSRVIDSGISDQQLIFVQKKWNKSNKHNNALVRSLKHYTANLFVKGLRNKNIKKIVPTKEISIKNNNQDWFDLVHAREKLFLKFKKSKLHIDEEIYKRLRNQVRNLIKIARLICNWF